MSLRTLALNQAASPWFNRLAGILLTPSRWLPRRHGNIREARSILVIKSDEIGDVILATGFLRALRQACPLAHITVAVRSMATPLISMPAMGDEMLPWDEQWRTWPFGIRPWLHLVRTARARSRLRRPDWVLIPRSCGDHMLMVFFAWWSGAPRICTHESLCIDWKPDLRPLVNELVPEDTRLHEITQHGRMLAHLGLPGTDLQPKLDLPAAAVDHAERVLAQRHLPSLLVALGPGAGAADRRWPVAHFVALTRDLLARQPNIGIIVVGDASVQADGELIRAVAPERVANFSGQATLLQSAALLARCQVYVGNDSGPMHLAAAMECAIVEISKHPIGADDRSSHAPLRFGPATSRRRVLQPQPLEPACAQACTQPVAHCITAVTVPSVVAATLELLISQRSELVPHGRQ